MNEATHEANQHIEGFDLKESNFEYRNIRDFHKSADKSNKVYSLTDDLSNVKFRFKKGVKNTTIFIDKNVTFVDCEIKTFFDNCTIYIGRDCILKTTKLIFTNPNGNIFVGKGVTTTAHNEWNIGGNTGVNQSIIIGDDCMFAANVTLRAGDGHIVCNPKDLKQINSPKDNLVVEPYVWIGFGAQVLKGVRIGGGSIISLGSIVTKDIPQRSVAKGVPANFSSLGDNIWTRNLNKKSIELMKKYDKLFPADL